MLPRRVLLDDDVFLSYLLGDKLHEKSAKVVVSSASGEVAAFVSSEVNDDLVIALRSSKVPLDKVAEFMEAASKIPHKPLPVTPEIAIHALTLYAKHGGAKRLHYFDSFHVATAKHHGLPLVTSDRYILKHADELGIKAIDLAKI